MLKYWFLSKILALSIQVKPQTYNVRIIMSVTPLLICVETVHRGSEEIQGHLIFLEILNPRMGFRGSGNPLKLDANYMLMLLTSKGQGHRFCENFKGACDPRKLKNQ